MKYELLELKQELKEELTHNILPFWMEKMVDEIQGGFYGQINGKNQVVPHAPKGAILNARILWSFSAAALYFKNPLYTQYARIAKDYIFKYFFDATHGGTYWMLNADGTPADTKKQIYSQAFFIYALVEYYRVTGDKECLDKAIVLFRLIEIRSFDKEKNGYFDAYSQDWKQLEDMRLSPKVANEKKTMNTHLHLLEAYTNLYRVWDNLLLEKQLKNLIELFLNKIVNSKSGHLDLFFDENWECKSTLISYGHNIEASWLLEEAAEVLHDAVILEKVKHLSLKIAKAAAEGVQPNGSIVHEKNYTSGHVDTNCHWWSQAEAMVGFYNAYELSKDETYAEKTIATWKFIKEYIIDKKQGEWYSAVSSEGKVFEINDKAGFWKCPYHNSRMCLELMTRIV